MICLLKILGISMCILLSGCTHAVPNMENEMIKGNDFNSTYFVPTAKGIYYLENSNDVFQLKAYENGKSKTILEMNGNAADLVYAREKLYFVCNNGIYEFDLTGNQSMLCAELSAPLYFNMRMVEQTLCWMDKNGVFTIFDVETKEQKQYQLPGSLTVGGSFEYQDGKVYYQGVLDETICFLCYDTEQDTTKKILENESHTGSYFYPYLHENGNLYYIYDYLGIKKLFYIDKNGQVCDLLLDGVNCYNVYQDWIYYTTYQGVYKVKLDGSENQKLLKGKFTSVLIWNQTLYVPTMEKTDSETGREKVILLYDIQSNSKSSLDLFQ